LPILNFEFSDFAKSKPKLKKTEFSMPIFPFPLQFDANTAFGDRGPARAPPKPNSTALFQFAQF
jgi:hypothetical protein